MTELEQERQLLGLELPNLIGEWARLNDTHIVAVRGVSVLQGTLYL
jgi:hypothetical protein